MIITNPAPGMLSGAERALGCWVVNGDDLEPYDVVLLSGRQFLIERLPQEASRVYPAELTRVIVADGGQRITWAVPSQMYRILPRVGA